MMFPRHRPTLRATTTTMRRRGMATTRRGPLQLKQQQQQQYRRTTLDSVSLAPSSLSCWASIPSTSVPTFPASSTRSLATTTGGGGPFATTSPSLLPSSSSGGGSRKTGDDHVLIPGTRHEYGSLMGDRPLPSRPAVPWQAAHNIDVQRVTQKAIVYELAQQQSATLESVVPWFLETMPPSYFRQVPERFRNDHIKAIAAVKDANMDLYLNLKTHLGDGRQVLTFVRPGTQPGTLLHMVEQLPWQHNADDYIPLTRILVFSTKDETMSLNMFVYGNKQTPATLGMTSTSTTQGKDDEASLSPAALELLDYAARLQAGDPEAASGAAGLGLDPTAPLLQRPALIEYLHRCSDNYINASATDPRRFWQQRVLFEQVSGTEGTRVHMEEAAPEEGEVALGHLNATKHYWVDVAVANSLPQVALEHLCRLLFLHDLDVTRARLDIIDDGANGTVTMLRMLVAPTQGTEVPDSLFQILALELRRVKWLDPSTMDLVFRKYPQLGVTRGEILTAFASLMHAALAKENPMVYSKANIMDTIASARVLPHSTAIADLFLDRFDPADPLTDPELEARCDAIVTEIANSEVQDDSVTIDMLRKMMDIVRHTLKTNVYMPDRYALGLRLDPRIMSTNDPGATPQRQKETPYGILFVHGRRFNGFHVRFRDIARGGLRLVTPRSPEMYGLESARHYDECYGLALAQQLKNKDIPEGGSKAVALINNIGLSPSGQGFVMRKSVKAFTDTVLDLIVQTDETKANIVDLIGKKEVLYLGPDEQVIPDDINWIIQRAAYRGYDTPAAFMSSKPRAGINHKQYGVTSEGVNVYLDVALRQILGIDPKKDSFTIKITGGPDGDVAGNEMKILIREYGTNAKIVGVADASGCAEDPRGLDQGELMRLFHAALSISHFDASKLGPDGVLHTVDTPEGVKARNTMHNRLRADAFVPCGGRPGTIDSTNYRQFLDKETGVPSSKLIVEGANLFITGDARKALFEEAGVVIVKDSSANKGGVITSSYEICGTFARVQRAR